MKAFSKLLCFIFCLVILLVSAGCNNDYKDAYIYFELNTIPDTLDPQLINTDDEATVVRCLFDTLLRYNNEGKLVPSAAESYTKEGLTYTFKLNKDATWTDGTAVTAQDFCFGLKRAVNPETASPFAYTLSAIKNAEKILDKKADVESLGVSAVDDYTLKIELSREDSEFLNTLTTPISMPCNEEFFKGAKATYGLSLDSIICNGSYYVRIWEKEESFLIRLAKNLNFKGEFEANSMRVYFTCSDTANYLKIVDSDSDLGFVSASDYTLAKQAELNTLSIENQCYILAVGNNINKDLRKALITSVDTNSYKNELLEGYRLADTIFPASLGIEKVTSVANQISYDITSAASLYNKVVKREDSSNLSLKYVNDPTCEEVAKALAAHWQQHLGAFINIEKVSIENASLAYKNQNSILIMPFSVSSGNYKAYISAFGSEKANPSEAQKEILANFNHLPLFFKTNYIAFKDNILINKNHISNGIPDMALIIKSE